MAKSETASKLKMQRKINKLLEMEIAALTARVEQAVVSAGKPAKDAHKPKEERAGEYDEEEGFSGNVLDELEEGRHLAESAELHIVRRRPQQPYMVSYNDKRNAIKQEKRLFRSFNSQDKLELARPDSPKQSPKVNNYVAAQGSTREVAARQSYFRNARDRNKSANTLLHGATARSMNKSSTSAKVIALDSRSDIERASDAKVRQDKAQADEKERASRLVSINVSDSSSSKTVKVYDKVSVDLASCGPQPALQHNSCANVHFMTPLDKNASNFAIFEVSDAYLLSLAADPSPKPSMDSRMSVELDYSHSMLQAQPRLSSLVQAPALLTADSKLNRPGRVP